MTIAPPAPITSARLRLGPLELPSPVVLAPMAGITNAAFRRLCIEQGGGAHGQPNGLYVSEMTTSRGVVEGDPRTLAMLRWHPSETVRSVQLFGVDPGIVGRAVAILCAEHGVDHVDLNFGCPVPKVTRRGGGAALPWKLDLLRAILTSAVRAAEPYGVPVTMKTRKGIDDDHLTFLDAGRTAQDVGVAAIALHGRTAAQHYSGRADWDAIAALRAAVDIPVLGNGDVWEAADALRMVERTGVDGVVVGRGCLGRPWLFRDLATAFRTGRADTLALPTLGEVAAVIRRHGELLTELIGEDRGVRDLRKHMAWYLKGFAVGADLRQALGMVDSLARLDELLDRLDPGQRYPVAELGTPRGRQGSERRVTLPHGWLDDRSGLAVDLADAELDTSGG